MKVQHTLVAFSGLFSLVAAFPAVKRDSSINEPAVAAPNGTPITLTPGARPTGVDNSNANSNDCPSGNCNSQNNGCMNGDCSSSSGCMSGNCDSTSMMMDSSTMMMDSSSTMMMDSTSTMMMDSSSTMMMDSTSTMMMESTSTMTSEMAYATYGSGYSPSSYDSCVKQCMASYAPPPSMVTATPSYPPSYNNGAQGSGATHTVWVAPTQGVLRYVPFAVNASVGDTVRFVWGAGPHTVTKSSQFNLCNKTADAPFTSGKQNKSFVYDQVVNDTNPTFYYCSVPNHCAKGMFGIINPPNAQPGSASSVQAMGAMMAQNNSDVSAQWQYMMMNTQNNTAAANWGMNMDMSAMTTDPEGQLAIAQNMMFTRVAMAMNDKYITPEGGFNPDTAAGFAVPMDPLKITAASSSGSNTTTPSGGSNNVGDTPSGTASDAAASATSTGGASRRVASSATAVFAAIAIAAFVL